MSWSNKRARLPPQLSAYLDGTLAVQVVAEMHHSRVHVGLQAGQVRAWQETEWLATCEGATVNVRSDEKWIENDDRHFEGGRGTPPPK